jgi:GGDEF domain-containing protein
LLSSEIIILSTIWAIGSTRIRSGLTVPGGDSSRVEPANVAGKEIPVTISVGVAAWDEEVSAQEVLRLADEATYRAKREGRNRAVAAGSGLSLVSSW